MFEQSGGGRSIAAHALATTAVLALLLWAAFPHAQTEPERAADVLLCEEAIAALRGVEGVPSEEAWTSTNEACEAFETSYLEERSGPAAESDARYAQLMSAWALARVEFRGDCAGALRVLGRVAHTLEVLPSEAQAAFARASHQALSCPPPPPLPTHGEAVLAVGGEPATLRGVAGGLEDASARFGGSCVGAVPASPNHTFVVPEDMDVSVVVFADTDEDLTLAVRGPGGTFCNDDFYGFDPAVSAELSPGTYEVYVGEFIPTPLGTEYQATIGREPLRRIVPGSPPSYGTVTFMPGEAEAVASGFSGGPVTARAFGTACLGLVDERPNHRLEVTGYGRVSIRVTALEEADLTLVVVGPVGTFCNDDFDGFDPAVSEWMPAGTYDVYVGHRLGDAAPYEIRFSSEDLFAVEAGRVTPRFGTVTVDVSASRVVAGVAGGPDLAGARFGPDCRGYISWEPSHTLYVEQDTTVWLEAGGATGDLTLILTGPSGTTCSDDFRGRDPALSSALESGTYDVYVGEFTPTTMGTSYGLRVSAGDPGVAVEPPPASLTLGPGPAQTAFWGTTLSDGPASDRFGSECAGFIPHAPNAVVTLAEGALLTVGAASGETGDLVLVVEGAVDIACNDDYDELNPRISRWLPAGSYGIYVGEYDQTLLGTPFAARIEVDPGGVEPPPITIAPPPSPTESIQVVLGPELVAHVGTSGGSLRARRFGPACVGYLPAVAQFTVEVPTGGNYEIVVGGDGDTTLVVDGPGGPFCNDDYDGFNPRIAAFLEAGSYEVYVGSYNPRHEHAFQISFRAITEAPEEPLPP